MALIKDALWATFILITIILMAGLIVADTTMLLVALGAM